MVLAQPIALITGYGGYSYLQNHLSGETNPIQAKPMDELTEYALYYNRILGLSIVNVLKLFFTVMFPKFSARQ